MEIQFRIAGILLISLSLIHIVFPKYFNWNTELQSLSLINRQMMWIHTFFVALSVFLMGLLCLSSAKELIGTSFGKKISLALGLFWGTRLFIQFFGYSSNLWKGKTFETAMHILFSLFWIYLSSLFLTAYFM